MVFNSTNSGQWLFPDLFYTFQAVVPFSGDTIEFIMIDTESLIGGVNEIPDVLPLLYYPPPAPGPGAAMVRVRSMCTLLHSFPAASGLEPTFRCLGASLRRCRCGSRCPVARCFFARFTMSSCR